MSSRKPCICNLYLGENSKIKIKFSFLDWNVYLSICNHPTFIIKILKSDAIVRCQFLYA
ncbi:hypothetical protein RhiirA4_471461 [Rhizophagus irregularis]|uniref:Uncharacterized protein n=1 Tax=Rhizophagus irregularis TaxID=588596 RepID=A0A2I1H3B8_9GLOM|nr:hypothetical protein RhiirA4_471461 [Rhizophagus irregularis]